MKVTKIYKDGKTSETFGPHPEGYLNYIVGGFITGNGGQLGICNMFDFDTEKMIFDADKKAADLEKYGLLYYETFKGIISKEFFDANPFAYIKVAFGNGLVREEDFKEYTARLSVCFFERGNSECQ